MNKRKRKVRPGYQRRDVTQHADCPRDLGAYTAINHTTGECYFCDSIDHVCAVAFGRNKRNHNQDWMACVRGDGYFVVL